MNQVLAIYDTDTMYSNRLLEIFKKYNSMNFKILVFTKEESIKEYLKKSKIEILLLGEGQDYNNFLEEKVSLILCLSHMKETKEDAIAPKILKYQKGSQIWEDILRWYYKKHKVLSIHREGTPQFYSIFAPNSFGDDSIFAEYFARQLSEQNRVLYIPLEFFPVSSISVPSNMTHSISELIYSLKNESFSVSNLISYITFDNKLSYLSGITHGFDLLSLNKEDAISLIKNLSQCQNFDYIIFYLGFYSEFVIEILNESLKTMILVKDEILETQRYEELFRQIDFAGVSAIRSNMRQVFVDLSHQQSIEEKKKYLWYLSQREIESMLEENHELVERKITASSIESD